MQNPISPWLSMWYSPRNTIRQIVDINARNKVSLLSALIGISWALDQLSTRKVGDNLSFSFVLGFAVIGGPIIGIFFVYLMGALLYWAGKKFGGKASVEDLRAAYAWSWIPNIWMLPFWLIQIVIFGAEIFKSTTTKIEANPSLAIILLGFTFANVITGLLSFFFIVNCVSEIQAFSNWRALGSIIVSLLILLIPLFCILELLSGFHFGA